MKRSGRAADGWVRVLICALMLVAFTVAARPQTAPDFSGLWKQDNDRCRPIRRGDVTLRIQHRDPELIVETTIARDSRSSGHAAQRYTTDGKASVSTGADGDEFHTSIVWDGPSLIFSIEEHEEGRILQSKETWSLIESGATLQRTRERGDGEQQVLFYRRQQAGSNSELVRGNPQD